MIKKACKKIILILLLGLLFCIPTKNAKAIDYDNTGIRSFTNCVIEIGGYNYAGIANNGGCSYITNTNNSYRTGWANNFTMTMNAALPGKAIVILQGRYVIPGDKYAFNGFSGNSQLSPISSSLAIEQDSNSYELNFTYAFFTPVPLSSIVLDSPLSLWVANNETRIDFTKLSYVTLTSEPTRQQITQLQNSINEINAKSTTTNANLEIIRGYLETIIDNSDRTADAVEEQNEKDDQDRNDIQEQSSTNETDANEQGDQAEQTGTSLFSAFTQLLGALTNVSGGSCTLPSMQVYSLNLGSMNLCTYSIPPQIMALVSIGMVFIIIPLGIHLVKRMIALYKEITG